MKKLQNKEPVRISVYRDGSSNNLFAFIKLFMILLTDGGKVKERLLRRPVRHNNGEIGTPRNDKLILMSLRAKRSNLTFKIIENIPYEFLYLKQTKCSKSQGF